MSYTPSDTIKDSEVYREFQEIARALAEMPTLPLLYREPFKPREGNFCICDGVYWNPLSDGVKRPIIFLNGAWQAF